MMSSPPKQEVGVGVFLLKGTGVLLCRLRTAVGFGTLALLGGHLEIFHAIYLRVKVSRNARLLARTGLDITGMELVTVTNNVRSEPKPVQLIAILWCDGWDWYDWDHLPKPLFPPFETAVLRGINPFPAD